MEHYLHTLEALRTRAKNIQRSLGTRVAAGYLRNRGVGLHAAVHILARRAS